MLTGLLVWRIAVPRSPLWLDLVALAGVAMVVLTVKQVLRGSAAPERKDANHAGK